MKLLPALACMLAITTSASASDICTINKTPGEEPGQNYTLRVYTTDGSDVIYFDEAKSNLTDGTLEFSFAFGQTSGSYPYTIVSETGLVITDTLDYIDPDEFKNAFVQLSKDALANNVSAVKQDLFDTYSNVFRVAKGFSVNDSIIALGNIDPVIVGFIADINKVAAPTIDTVQKLYRKNMLLFAIENGTPELIAKSVSSYGDVLDLTDEAVNKYYNAMTATAKQDTASIEKGFYTTTADFASAHATAVALGAMNATSQYVEIGTILNDLSSSAGLSSIGSYSATQRSNILKNLAKATPFKSKSDYEAKLKKAIEASKTSDSSPSKSTGGGGGGGGSVSVTTRDDTVADKTTQIVDYLVAPFVLKDRASVVAIIKGLIK